MLLPLPNAFGQAALNMAIDATLMATVPPGAVLFRHYGWTEPSLTFGYSQKIDAVRPLTPADAVLCRRLTGGGIVDHRNDWTYALILHRKTPCSQINATELYRHIHEAVAAALGAIGITTRMAPCPRECDAPPMPADAPDQCFLQPVMNDVLGSDGRKVAGAAMKRGRRALLIQGSIDRGSLPENFPFADFEESLIQALAKRLHLRRHPPEDLRRLFDRPQIAREAARFADTAWTERR